MCRMQLDCTQVQGGPQLRQLQRLVTGPLCPAPPPHLVPANTAATACIFCRHAACCCSAVGLPFAKGSLRNSCIALSSGSNAFSSASVMPGRQGYGGFQKAAALRAHTTGLHQCMQQCAAHAVPPGPALGSPSSLAFQGQAHAEAAHVEHQDEGRQRQGACHENCGRQDQVGQEREVPWSIPAAGGA